MVNNQDLVFAKIALEKNFFYAFKARYKSKGYNSANSFNAVWMH